MTVSYLAVREFKSKLLCNNSDWEIMSLNFSKSKFFSRRKTSFTCFKWPLQLKMKHNNLMIGDRLLKNAKVVRKIALYARSCDD